tara:strand:+ start:251 stop:979 length:729 start_codon:yes stop_codon:yes gene_type:complete
MARKNKTRKKPIRTKRKSLRYRKSKHVRKPKYTKKRVNRHNKSVIKKKNKISQEGGITMVETVLIPIIIENLGKFLEGECVKYAKKNNLKNSNGEPIESCGLSDIKNSKDVSSFVIKKFTAYIKERLNKYGKKVPPIFLENLRLQGLGNNPLVLRKKENREKLMTAIKLTLNDPRIQLLEGDVGAHVYSLTRGGIDKQNKEGIIKRSLKRIGSKFSRGNKDKLLENQSVSKAHAEMMEKLNP